MVDQDKVETSSDVRAWVAKHWKLLFAHALSDWFTDETMWPQNRTLKMFDEWFEVQFHSMVWDMEAAQITHQDWDDE